MANTKVKYKNIKRMSKEKILKDYGAVVNSYVKGLEIPHNLINDAYQEGYLILMNSIKTYDNTRSSFCTHLYYNLMHGLQKFLYKQLYPYGCSWLYYRYKKEKGAQLGNVPLDENINLIPTEQTQNEDDLKVINLFCEKVNRKYDQKTVDMIIHYYIEGMKYKDLKKKYGNIEKSIISLNKSCNLQEIFEEIKQEMKEELECI